MAKHTEQNRHTGNREKALTALLCARSVREASELSGLGERTIYRYLSEAAFKKTFRDARRQTVETAIAALQTATGDAVHCLLRNLHCEQHAVEVRAAQIVLDTAIRGIEILDFENRLERLEEITNAKVQDVATTARKRRDRDGSR